MIGYYVTRRIVEKQFSSISVGEGGHLPTSYELINHETSGSEEDCTISSGIIDAVDEEECLVPQTVRE